MVSPWLDPVAFPAGDDISMTVVRMHCRSQWCRRSVSKAERQIIRYGIVGDLRWHGQHGRLRQRGGHLVDPTADGISTPAPEVGNRAGKYGVGQIMSKMTRTERETYLADLHVGVIGIERPDRAPLTVPIWYVYEPGGEVLVSSLAGSLKARLITAAGRFSITAQDETYPYRYVTAEGSLTSIETADDATMRVIAVRYLGEEGGNAFTESFARDHPEAESLLFRMRPEHWLSVDYSKES